MSQIGFILITYLLYRMAKKAYQKWPLPFLHPLFISPVLLIVLISLIHVSADEYLADVKWLTHLLGPATVAFAIPIYKHGRLLKKYFGNIVVSITTGSFVAIISTFALSMVGHLQPDMFISILPRSITTPIAIEVSKEIGGIPPLTTVFVIMTGIFGGVMGPSILKKFSIKSPVARGLALGMGAHGVGTNKAMEYGEKEATFSTIAMIMAAWITLLFANSLIPALMTLVQ